jgi:hypothetical protein
MNLKETQWEDVDWLNEAQERNHYDQCNNLQVPLMAGNFLPRCVTISF